MKVVKLSADSVISITVKIVLKNQLKSLGIQWYIYFSLSFHKGSNNVYITQHRIRLFIQKQLMINHYTELNLPDAILLFFFRSISYIGKNSSKTRSSKEQNKSQITREVSLKNVSGYEWSDITINNLIMPIMSKDHNHKNREFISYLVSDH